MRIKHSKIKNTGILFELLVRQITSDTLKGIDSSAIKLLRTYFVKTELGREHKLYESLLKCKQLPETQANIYINTILETSKKLNRKNLRKQKYNLIKEIKKNYNIEYFFGSKINKYKVLASIYTLIESKNSPEYINPTQIVENKILLLEYLTRKGINKEEVKKDVLEEFKNYDKDLRILTYQIILEKFNDKYEYFNFEQKLILREYINSIDSTPKLRNFYNSKIRDIKTQLLKEVKKIKNLVTQIKINEICKFLKELDKSCKFDDEHLVDLLQYYELLEEVKHANKV